jgi:hypothetical protein
MISDFINCNKYEQDGIALFCVYVACGLVLAALVFFISVVLSYLCYFGVMQVLLDLVMLDSYACPHYGFIMHTKKESGQFFVGM